MLQTIVYHIISITSVTLCMCIDTKHFSMFESHGGHKPEAKSLAFARLLLSDLAVIWLSVYH